MHMKRILVIVVSYNGLKWMEKCLCSVFISHMKADVMVIDNASSDGTPEMIEEQFGDKVKLVRSKENLGFGQANNIGLKYALEQGYDYAYLLNQDAWLLPNTLSEMMAVVEESERLKEGFGIYSPMQMSATPDKIDSRFVRWYRVSGPITEAGVKEMEFVMAAHWLISRECMEAVGGFSPAFSQYGEDDNYIQRARFHGFKAGAINAASAIHDREQRQESKERRMRLKCVASVVKVSDPTACLAWRLVRQPLELVGMSMLRLSLIPLRFIPSLVRRYPSLVRLRRASKSKGAFLD